MKDEWAAYCFDNATSVLGNYVEGKLAELDEKGNAKYTLKQILSFEKPKTLVDSLMSKNTEAAGLVKVVKGK